MTIQKKVLVEFDEQSKAVTAKVSIEYTSTDGNTPLESLALGEAKAVFEQAQQFALTKSLLRNR